jgi:hypothetical protein
MFESVPSYIRTNLSLFIILGIFLFAALFSYFLYRRTIPPLNSGWRVTLAVIRGIAVTLIVMLVFSPKLTLVWQQRVTDKVVLVIDRSASMGLVEKGESRLDRARKIAQSLWGILQRNARVSLYAFNTDTMSIPSPNIDSAQFATDMESALTHIIDKEKNLTALIMLSDGNFTTGRNPLFSEALTRCRIYTIGIGDTMEIPDVLISDVQANKIVYQHKETPVQVNLMARGFTGKETLLQIREQGRVLAAQKVKINTTGGIIPVSLNIKPEQIGIRQYEISVDKLPGETLLANNKHLLVLEVLKSKIQVGILASQPDFDVKFLHLLLSANTDLQVKMAVTDQPLKRTVVSTDDVLDSVDVLILHDFPALTTSRENLQKLEKGLNTKKIPTLLLWGDHAATVNWDFISRYYALRVQSFLSPVLKTQVLPTETGKTLPIINIYSSDQENLNFWQQCPPIEYPFEKVEVGKNLRSVLETVALAGRENVRAPVLLIEQSAGCRNAYLLGSGFWRWYFMLAEDRLFQAGWQNILNNLVRWLSIPGSSSNVLISTDKRSYQVGETVRISCEAYDGAYNPVDDGMVHIKVSGPGGVFELEGGLVGQGTYTADFQLLGEGEYTLEAQALRNDVILGQASTRIVATPVNVEFLYTRQDYQLLKKLADKSGGRYVAEDNYRDLLGELNFPVRYQEVTQTYEIWQKALILLLIIFLFSLEWFIRKRLGLA